MKITQTVSPQTYKLLKYEDLVEGEVYYATGSPSTTWDSMDGALYMFDHAGGLMDLSNGHYYPFKYAGDSLKKWRYREADVELLEYSRAEKE